MATTSSRMGSFYNEKLAKSDLRKYQSAGPRSSTRTLIEALKAEGVEGAPLLDIGGRSTGRFMACIDVLKDDLGDPVADRIIETLRVAREVGGTDLGLVLRTLATFLREDARVRAELQTRRGWTVGLEATATVVPHNPAIWSDGRALHGPGAERARRLRSARANGAAVTPTQALATVG